VRIPTFDSAGGKRREIAALVSLPGEPYRPPYPVVIEIHGGPEGQARPGFEGRDNYLVMELGIAHVRPNVRGSTGYGKTFAGLDNGRLREDSVKDIGAVLDWIATRPELDRTRVCVMGSSYGGYMSLASMVHFSDRLRCGIDIVGISDFVTFLESTSEYRRALRRVEYGDEREPEMRSFLKSISPLARAERIAVPMLVVQGANDPRVPRTEAEQMVRGARGRGKTVWYVLGKDEGHGFAKKANADFQQLATLRFLEEFLLK
jgi:dipeptidyl aminopeptidase/acylaminoacyl peptidase